MFFCFFFQISWFSFFSSLWWCSISLMPIYLYTVPYVDSSLIFSSSSSLFSLFTMLNYLSFLTCWSPPFSFLWCWYTSLLMSLYLCTLPHNDPPPFFMIFFLSYDDLTLFFFFPSDLPFSLFYDDPPLFFITLIFFHFLRIDGYKFWNSLTSGPDMTNIRTWTVYPVDQINSYVPERLVTAIDTWAKPEGSVAKMLR